MSKSAWSLEMALAAAALFDRAAFAGSAKTLALRGASLSDAEVAEAA